MAKTTYSREELERQLSESRREFWAADATINNLELKLAEMAEQLANAENKCAAPVSVPAERAAFETFMEKRFKDLIDRRLLKNGDGEYFAWDMQVAWIVWQERAAMLQRENDSIAHDGKNHPEDKLGMVGHFGDSNNMAEPETDNTNKQFESLSRGDK